MRLFVALELPESVRARLAEVRSASREEAWRWVAPESIHLTLKFLGETPPERLPALRETLAEIAADSVPMELELAGLATIPPRRPGSEPQRQAPPRVLYAVLRREAEWVRELAWRVEERMTGLGFPRETRPHLPHATLARVREGRHPQDAHALLERFAALEFGRWTADRLVLFESRLTTHGPRYTPQGIHPFTAG